MVTLRYSARERLTFMWRNPRSHLLVRCKAERDYCKPSLVPVKCGLHLPKAFMHVYRLLLWLLSRKPVVHLGRIRSKRNTKRPCRCERTLRSSLLINKGLLRQRTARNDIE